jgi:hypothetical protein
VGVSDEYGHGPDVGSGEWYSSVEFLTGLSKETSLPEAGTDAWCEVVERSARRK